MTIRYSYESKSKYLGAGPRSSVGTTKFGSVDPPRGPIRITGSLPLISPAKAPRANRVVTVNGAMRAPRACLRRPFCGLAVIRRVPARTESDPFGGVFVGAVRGCWRSPRQVTRQKPFAEADSGGSRDPRGGAIREAE